MKLHVTDSRNSRKFLFRKKTHTKKWQSLYNKIIKKYIRKKLTVARDGEMGR